MFTSFQLGVNPAEEVLFDFFCVWRNLPMDEFEIFLFRCCPSVKVFVAV